jgi:hypothetical protein
MTLEVADQSIKPVKFGLLVGLALKHIHFMPNTVELSFSADLSPLKHPGKLPLLIGPRLCENASPTCSSKIK